MSRNPRQRDRLAAAFITLALCLAIVLVLGFGKLHYDPSLLTENASKAEIMPPDDEELFVEPQILDLGEEAAPANDRPAPAIKGTPEPAPVENTHTVTPAKTPKPTSPAPEPPVAQTKPSPVKATQPTATDREKEKVTSTVANSFAPHNGTAEGADKTRDGAGHDGVGVQGSVRGRTFKGCPTPQVSLRHKTVVRVDIVVDEQGHVTSASATGSADAAVRRACEQAALRASWSPRPGAGDTRGSITFTITPR